MMLRYSIIKIYSDGACESVRANEGQGVCFE